MDASNARKAIEEAGRKFGAAAGRKDFKAIAALYTEDGAVMPPDVKTVTGRADIEKFWSATVAALGIQEVTLNTEEVLSAGDLASELGHAVLKLATGSATVRYLVVWKRGGDGQWRLHRDIWNAIP